LTPATEAVVDPLDFVSSVARRSGELLLERFGGPHTVTEKHPRDIVTEADRASEAAVVAAVREHFPTAAILGEEGGVYAAPGNERFIVDPLDGTTNYAHGYPMFCVSLGYERDGVMEAGAIDAPFLGLHFTARRGGGAFLNGARIGVSQVARLDEALVCTGFNPADYDRNGGHFAALSRVAQGVRRDGSAALDLAFVAAGRFDAFWEWGLKPWDVAAGALLISEAGGCVTAIDGSLFDVAAGSIAASNRRLHDALRATLATVEPAAPLA
jgi:myo-inositol-1(or 4)-monophosphatase